MEKHPFQIGEDIKAKIDSLKDHERVGENARLFTEYAGNLAVTHFDMLHDIVANPNIVEGMQIDMTPEEANRAFVREGEQMSLEDERGWSERSSK